MAYSLLKKCGFDHGVGHLAYIPTTKRRDSGCYPHTGEYVVGNKGYRFSVILLIPQGYPQQVSLSQYITRSHADIMGRAPEQRREKVLEDSDVFLHGSRGQHGAPSQKCYDHAMTVTLSQSVACEGTMRSRLACDPRHNR
jgi:hypothetical protein